MAKKLSIVIPAFNEEGSLPALFERLDNVVRGDLGDMSVEVVIVDDHSTDRTGAILEEGTSKYPWLRFVRLLRNSGSHIAIFAGFSVCTGDYAFVMSADMQDPPEVIRKFVEEMGKGYKAVFGERESRDDPFSRRFFSVAFNQMMGRFILPNYPRRGGDIIMLDRSIIDAIVKSVEYNANIYVLVLSLCQDIGYVKYVRSARYAGKSKWYFKRSCKLAYDTIVMTGVLPFKAMFWIGLWAVALSLLLATTLVVGKIAGWTNVRGWILGVVAVSGFSGIQLMAMSILGEYLGRNFEQTRKRPLFLIEKSSRGASADSSQ